MASVTPKNVPHEQIAGAGIQVGRAGEDITIINGTVNSKVYQVEMFKDKSIWIYNDTDQTITVQFWGFPDQDASTDADAQNIRPSDTFTQGTLVNKLYTLDDHIAGLMIKVIATAAAGNGGKARLKVRGKRV